MDKALRVAERAAREIANVDCVRAVVLGGSRATGTAGESSDIDIGVYYDGPLLDYDRLNRVARELDDKRREGLICREGEWGGWVNCGGWLKVEGIPVDILLRDTARVREVIEETDGGRISCHYQTGHPHAYINVMYRGELAASRVLYSGSDDFIALKRRAEAYSEPMRESLWGFFRFEAGFSLSLAEKSVPTGDFSYCCGHLFRAVSALNQALFALNRVYCLNEKKAVFRVDAFDRKPEHYSMRVNRAFSVACVEPARAIDGLRRLLCEAESLYREENAQA